jgi:hypothetical protein
MTSAISETSLCGNEIICRQSTDTYLTVCQNVKKFKVTHRCKVILSDSKSVNPLTVNPGFILVWVCRDGMYVMRHEHEWRWDEVHTIRNFLVILMLKDAIAEAMM